VVDRSPVLESISWLMLPGARRVLDGILAISIAGTSLTANAASSASPWPW
jgi:hypothetical protein